jgi:hypothetical protein
MCTFHGLLEMAFALGAVGKDEEMGRAGIRRERSMFLLFMACLSHNPENHRNGQK